MQGDGFESSSQPYWTLESQGESELVVERSRFIGFASRVVTEGEALARVDEIRRRFHDARHVCYALRIGRGVEQVERGVDDGEPGRSAGFPMLQILQGRELCDTLVVVVRYFGGIKLGVGGLARAYREAARMALDDAVAVERFPEVVADLVVPYSVQAQVEHLLDGQQGVRVIETHYGAEVCMRLAIRCVDRQMIETRLAALLQRDERDVLVETVPAGTS
ncbi:YigZ family protein [Lujinxingia sediminis]|uniref:YigZ family protein n=1 Tax=Lujinxingia sediminis TaxID=2480984 RepID=A0ABY0CQS2_9DELT|nr:YigZ family protein [Lujinxingia sediminis]RVU42869.1 YigZ family protein [Lujinxingia sediminis]